MKGIIYNLLEEVVSAEHGEDARTPWDALVDAAGVDGVYTSLGSYADEDLERLVAAASEHLGASPDEVVRWFGRRTMPLFAQRYGALFTAHASTRSFALALNDVIHPEVHKLYPGAATPVFVFDTSSQSTLVMEYRSARRLLTVRDPRQRDDRSRHMPEHREPGHLLLRRLHPGSARLRLQR